MMVDTQPYRTVNSSPDVEALAGSDQLRHGSVIFTLAQELIEHVPIPERAELGALHIAFATVHGMDYLLTWNCTHIANATFRYQIETICRSMGYEPPIRCILHNGIISCDVCY